MSGDGWIARHASAIVYPGAEPVNDGLSELR
jgi:hypothetical protein